MTTTRFNPEILEKSVAVLAMMLFSGTVLPQLLLTGFRLPVDPEAPGLMAVFGVLYFLILGVIAMRPRVAASLLTISPALTALILLTFASCLWSIEPDITLRRAIAFLFTTIFAVYLALRYRLTEIVRLLAIALSILAVLSLLFVVAMPAVGVDDFLHVGAWRGVFFQKNVAGRAMVWLFICLYWMHLQDMKPRWLIRGFLGLNLLMLVMSGSGTSLMSVILIAAVFHALRFVKADVRTLIPGLAFLALVGLTLTLAMTVFYEDVLTALGRDPTLTGRTEVWDHTIQSVMERLVSGYGYGAYWYSEYGPAAVFRVGWGIQSAHNGLIEVMLDVGIFGMALVLAVIGRVLFQGFYASRYVDHHPSARAEAAWIFTMGCAMATISLSESVYMERHSLNWVVLVIGMVALIRQAREARQAEAARTAAELSPAR